MNYLKKSTIAFLVAISALHAEKTESSLKQMPVEELTVFKDGHAFVIHEGTVSVEDSKATLNYVPKPILGTFWPFSADKNAELTSVIAGKQKSPIQEKATNLTELIKANIGKEVIIDEQTNSHQQLRAYEGKILKLLEKDNNTATPTINPDPFAYNRIINSPSTPVTTVLLDTNLGTKTVEIKNIHNITFKDSASDQFSKDLETAQLELNLKMKNSKSEAKVGLMYLEKGFRWIPNYKIDIINDKEVIVKLSATLINDLVDVKNVDLNLVVGVPSFFCQGKYDPIALQKDVVNTHRNRHNYFTNQVAVTNSTPSIPEFGSSIPVPSSPNSNKNQDLFLYRLKNISLKKGQRMTLPVSENRLSYTDIYSLNIPFTAPVECYRNLDREERRAAMLLNKPAVKHKIRIKNSSEQPFTTAPALVLKNGLPLAQGCMTYASIGGTSDITLTSAIDINVTKKDNEVKRTPNAVRWHHDDYGKIELEGTVSLKNFKDKTVTVEITRHFLGRIDKVDGEGKISYTNQFEDDSFHPDAPTSRHWWHSYSWPWWWFKFNSIGKVQWEKTIEPGQQIDLNYNWHYMWN